MLLSLRTPAFQLCLFVLVLVAVAWYRDSVKEATRLWYNHVKSDVDLNGTYEHRKVTHEGSKIDHAPVRIASHTARSDGLLETNMKGRHPLLDLVEGAERQWERLNAKQSTTLAEAVAEYKARNSYPPPAGFDLWWEFVQKNKVKLVDEFDQINYDITPYLALSPAKFRERVDELADPNVGHHINITDGHVSFYGPLWWHGNQLQLQSMMMAFSRALPDLVMHGHLELRGDTWIGEDLRWAAQTRAKAGEYLTDEELRHFESPEQNSHTDRKNICMPDDPVFDQVSSPNTTTFIASHLRYMSPCSNPLMHRAPPLLFSPNAQIPRLTPRFVFSKHRPDSGLLLPSNTWEYYDPLLEVPHAWEERHGEGMERLFWQGPVTGWNWFKGMGVPEPNITWRDGARPKFVLMFGANMTHNEDVEVLIERGGVLEMKTFKRTSLNNKWMDVSLSGSPIQCSTQDGTCEEMHLAPIWKEDYVPRKKNRRKFVADLDSNQSSEEFQGKLKWGNVVLKATTYPEWNSQWLIPYYHYIPMQTDYSDIYNIMAFFLGDPETGVGGHEGIAAKISRQASKFARENWRWEDMQAYLYRLMLEYVRLRSDDREAASFKL